MAADLATIRAGLATNLATLSTAPDQVQISAYLLGNPTPPCLQVMGPDEITWDLAMHRGLDEWTLIVQGFVGAATDIGSQQNLDLWIAPTGTQSVKTALESDATLGGTVQSLTVPNCTGYKIYQLDSTSSVLGAEWTVRVMNTGK